LLDVVHRHVLLPHADNALAETITDRSCAGASVDISEEVFMLAGVLSEACTHDAERAVRVAEALGDLGCGFPIHEEGTESLILAMERLLGGDKEATFRGNDCYLISITDTHILTMPHLKVGVKMLWRSKPQIPYIVPLVSLSSRYGSQCSC
jgi:hypothetical protein